MKVANISVAIPTVDRPEALSRCLEGLFKGSVLPMEVLIIDQGQNHSAAPVIAHFRSGPAPIIHCPQPRMGLSAARNLAAAQASCPIIAFTDDDCVPDSDWMEQLERTFTLFSMADGATGRILPLGTETPGQFAISIRTSSQGAEFRERALPWHIGSGGNFAVKRDWLLRIGGYDERLGTGSPGKAAEDADLFYRLLRSGAIIRYQPGAVIYHERQDSARLTRSFWNYSHGIGALTAKHLRRGDLYAAYILGVWLFWLFWRTGSAIVRRNRLYAGEGLLSLRGCTHGLAYGFRLG